MSLIKVCRSDDGHQDVGVILAWRWQRSDQAYVDIWEPKGWNLYWLNRPFQLYCHFCLAALLTVKAPGTCILYEMPFQTKQAVRRWRAHDGSTRQRMGEIGCLGQCLVWGRESSVHLLHPGNPVHAFATTMESICQQLQCAGNARQELSVDVEKDQEPFSSIHIGR